MKNVQSEVEDFNQNEKDPNWLLLKLPKGLNLSKVLPKYSTGLLQQALFIIHQCNYWTNQKTIQGGFSVSTDTLGDFFGGGGKVSMVLKDLQALDLIKKTRNFTIDGNSNTYEIVKPYAVKNDNDCDKYWFNIDNPKCPVFVKKFIADGRKILSKANSSYQSKAKIDKDARIKQLEDLLQANGIEIPDAVTEVQMTFGHVKPEVKPVLKDSVQAPDVIDTRETIVQDFFGEGFDLDGYPAFVDAVSDLAEDDIMKLVQDITIHRRLTTIGNVEIELNDTVFKFFNNYTMNLVVFNGIEIQEMAA